MADEEPDKEESESLYQRIVQMNVQQKAQLAMKGDLATRAILIRDANRMVQEAVLSNERITDNEIIAIANSRNVDVEILHRIAGDRNWLRLYEVRAALVKNPKTPVSVSVKLIPTLMPKDIKEISKSKTVPNVVVQVARRLVVQRELGK